MTFALGIMCEILATMVGTAGKQLVSYSGRTESKQSARLFKFSGLFITSAVGPILDLAAYSMAPQGIIAPLVGLDIVWNTFSAPFTLGEHLTKRHVLGSGLVFVGAAASSVFGPHEEEQASLDRLEDIFISWRFLAYLITAGILLTISFTTLASRPKGVEDKARGIALGATAGGIAGNMFFVSAGGNLVRSSISTGNYSAWQNWLPYPVLICAILVAVANIPFMTKGLQEYEALFMVTLFEGFHIVVACVSGIWVLGEMDNTAAGRVFLYWLCVWLIVVGLIVIQTTSNKRRPVHEESDPENHCGFQSEEGRAASSEAPVRSIHRAASGITVWASSISGVRQITFMEEDSDDPVSSSDEDFFDDNRTTAANPAENPAVSHDQVIIH
mmetsp:Transcript_98160/g.204760  ORF Transcript_98160/g.204760 Transcript_98160/m.204760 type:complete len:386 (+) Transcript_98160:54-1211(+)